MPVDEMIRSKKCRRKPRARAQHPHRNALGHFGMDARGKCDLCLYARPHLTSSPPGEEIAAARFCFADERPANPVVRIFKGTANDSPSPWGAGQRNWAARWRPSVSRHRFAGVIEYGNQECRREAGSWLHGFLIKSKAGYSKLVAAPLLDFSHLSKSAGLSTVRKPPDMAEWPLPQSWAQLIW